MPHVAIMVMTFRATSPLTHNRCASNNVALAIR